jgi:ABC-type phosphate transport system substrate-binding protein
MIRTLCLFMLLASSLALPLEAQVDDVVVVVHASNPTTTMTASEVSTLFLKRVTRWSSGERVEPIDQPSESSVRERFSTAIHGRDVAWVESYWNKMIFSGRASPPPKANNDRAVLSFVATNREAIGYVSRDTSLPSNVKAIAIVD